MLEKYKELTQGSERLWKRATKVFAGGVNHNLRQFAMLTSGAYPPYMRKGEGGRVWDVDDNEYVDWWMTHYSDILGHGHPAVKQAISQQLEQGIHLGALNEQMVQFGEMISDAIPTMKLMRFCTTGSESTMYAVRLARLFTKKPLVAKVRGGWHGGNDAVGYHVHAPYTDYPFYDGISFDFNDRESFDELLKVHGKNIAAVIVEPVLGAGGGLPPESGFLPYLREETEAREILLIFDEIITGFRLRYGTAGKELFGAEPDMVTLGKITAGGMPLGVYGGREDVMSLAKPRAEGGRWVGGGTFSSHPLSMVAGIAALNELRSKKTDYGKLNQTGDRFREKLNNSLIGDGVNAIATGTGSIIFISWLTRDVRGEPLTSGLIGENLDNHTQDLFQAFLMEQRVFGYHGLGALSFSHTKTDLDWTIDGVSNATVQMKEVSR